jgi:hypothetical protein
MADKFDFDEALEQLRSGQSLTGEDGVCSGQSKPDTLLRTVFKFYRCHIIQCRMQTT